MFALSIREFCILHQDRAYGLPIFANPPPFHNCPYTVEILSLNFIIRLPIKKRDCLLKLSSSSMVVAPGLRYLKGAMKVDSMLTFSRRKQKKKRHIKSVFCQCILIYSMLFLR